MGEDIPEITIPMLQAGVRAFATWNEEDGEFILVAAVFWAMIEANPTYLHSLRMVSSKRTMSGEFNQELSGGEEFHQRWIKSRGIE